VKPSEALKHPAVLAAMKEAQEAADAIVDRANAEIAEANERARMAENNAQAALQHSENLRKDLSAARNWDSEVHSEGFRAGFTRLQAEVALAHDLLDMLPIAPPRSHTWDDDTTILSLAQRITRMQR
jgi:hypothetical protein